MNWPATIANSLWAGGSLPAWSSFRSALHRPAEVQQNLLRSLLARNADCAYGRAHGFHEIKTYEEFTRRIPIADYEEFEPWIERIRRGELRVLTREAVTHLIPTSGSTGARKLIPFTAGLQREFDRAIGPWMVDLARQNSAILWGPAYWSITPAQPLAEAASSAVPIGFADDASYLGGVKSWLVRAAMAVPGELSGITDLDEFRFRTLLCLLRERDLRLISVWHPSFLTLLLDALPEQWGKLLNQLRREQGRRARELERADPRQPESLWPRLRVISAWGDSHAQLPMTDLRRRFPNVLVQVKGLLATEAFVTIPFGAGHPVAVRSHFFEFLDEQRRVRRVHELYEGETYEVIVTTAGGLWRYRMHDQIQVVGFVGRTPSLRFLGRNGNVSDRFGEKLSEAFVITAIQAMLAALGAKPQFVLLAPDEDAAGWRYTLYLEGALPDHAATTLDDALRRNPHYAHCRDIGQLQPVRVFAIAKNGFEIFAGRLVSKGKRLGDIKPTPLSSLAGWSGVFCDGEHKTTLMTKNRADL
jgi:hypothetical protein